MKKYWLIVCCLLGSAVLAQTADGSVAVKAERQRIAAERQQIEQRFAAEEAVCFQKFAVNDCRDASRARRRTDLADLRRQEILLNDAERKRKGAEQLQRMEQGTQQEGTTPAASAGEKPSARVRTRTPAAPRHDPAQAARAQAERKATLESKSRAQQEEQAARDRKAADAPQERAQYEKKLQEAAAHQEQVRRRNAARTKARAASLPEPAP